MRRMTDFIKDLMGKTPEEAIEHLEKSWAPPGSREHEMIRR
jgi:hypothetical protein